MVKDRRRSRSSSLKMKGCFFYLRGKIALFGGIAFFVFCLTSPACARQVLEYNSITGLWDYSEKDAAFSASSQQAIEYNTVTGLWDYSNRETAPVFPTRQVVGFNAVTGLWY